jgi:AraC-like DNA-binding protein
MIKWILKPANSEILKHVETYWFLNVAAIDKNSQYPKLNPDPAASLLVCTQQQQYRYSAADTNYFGKGSHWIYPQANTLVLDHSKPQQIIGIKFKVGGIFGLQRNIEHPITNHVECCDINNTIQSSHFDEPELLHLAMFDPESCCDLLDRLLLPWLSQRIIDKHSGLVDLAVENLPKHSIDELTEILHCTRRTLERHFLRITGLTLKQCQSMINFEALLQHIQTLDHNKIDWAELAFQFGFSDQPHLIRYVKNQIGETPAQYAQVRDLAIDRYGGVEMLRNIGL